MDSLKKCSGNKIKKTAANFKVNSLRFFVFIGDINITGLDTNELMITTNHDSLDVMFLIESLVD